MGTEQVAKKVAMMADYEVGMMDGYGAGMQGASLDDNSDIRSELSRVDGMAELKAISTDTIRDAIGAELWDDLSAESWVRLTVAEKVSEQAEAWACESVVQLAVFSAVGWDSCGAAMKVSTMVEQ
jgi:hypothetical protein